MQEKTNVMRTLDSKKIEYEAFKYDENIAIAGVDVASLLNEEPKQVFKTLVTQAGSNKYYVFVIPVDKELDLKKAAKAVNEKNIAMIKQKDLLGLTGYIHGGCSPIGMKKFYTTIVDVSAKDFEKIYISAGKVGFQIKIKVEDLEKVIKLEYNDVVK